jgi:hypothetical protein
MKEERITREFFSVMEYISQTLGRLQIEVITRITNVARHKSRAILHLKGESWRTTKQATIPGKNLPKPSSVHSGPGTFTPY